MIEIKNLSFKSNNKEILKNLNLKVKQGKITGIIGKNGSGKTTLIKHLSREIKTNNTIFLNGMDISKLNNKDFAKTFSFVFQNFENFGNFTVKELIKMGRYPYKKLFVDYTFEDEVITNNLIEKFNLKKIENSAASVISGGELKLSLIARSLAQSTPIIVLDEPINNLDINYQLKLMNLLKSLDDKTIIITIHDLTLALNFCDEVIILNDGILFDYGSTDEIINEVNIKKIFNIDCEIKKINNKKIIIYK